MPSKVSKASPDLASVFQRGPIILDHKGLAYNPCNDVIFPTIVKTAGRIRNPVDAYYMYYAPHDPPGGICMAHSPALTGPWTEYTANPLIQKDWVPHYNVGHVSAPHAIWVTGEERLFVYYHGDNDQTHYAVSPDGIHFTYGGVALSQFDYADYIPGTYDRIFYGRVYEHRLPSKDNAYIMLVVRSSNQGAHKQAIYLSWSKDARRWSTPVSIIEPYGDALAAWSPCLFRLGDRYYVAYHTEFKGSANDPKPHTNIWVDEFDADFSVRKPLGEMLEHHLFGADNDRVADPVVLVEGDTAYLAVSIDTWFNQRIALATANMADLEQALRNASRQAIQQ